MRHLAGPRAVALADLVDERRAAGVRQELPAVADEAIPVLDQKVDEYMSALATAQPKSPEFAAQANCDESIYEEAKDLGVKGRSTMTKDQLRRAVARKRG